MNGLLSVFLASGLLATQVYSSGTLPAPPTEQDLANDGSETAQEMLYERYAVLELDGPGHYQVGSARRTGDAPDLDAYLKSGGAPITARPWHRDPKTLTLLAFILGGGAAAQTGTLLFLAGGLAFSAVAAVLVVEPRLAGLTPLQSQLGLLVLYAAGVVGIVLLAAPPIVGLLALIPLLQRRATVEEEARRRSVAAFNTGLRERIRRAAR